MTRYQFDRAARPELLAQLIAAGFAPDTPVEFDGHPDASGAWVGGTACWVTCEDTQYDAAAAVVAAHDVAALNAADAAKVTAKAQARALVVQVAGSAVGTRFDALTAPQVRALLAILLYQAGALDGVGVVQPLGQWAK